MSICWKVVRKSAFKAVTFLTLQAVPEYWHSALHLYKEVRSLLECWLHAVLVRSEICGANIFTMAEIW